MLETVAVAAEGERTGRLEERLPGLLAPSHWVTEHQGEREPVEQMGERGLSCEGKLVELQALKHGHQCPGIGKRSMCVRQRDAERVCQVFQSPAAGMQLTR